MAMGVADVGESRPEPPKAAPPPALLLKLPPALPNPDPDPNPAPELPKPEPAAALPKPVAWRPKGVEEAPKSESSRSAFHERAFVDYEHVCAPGIVIWKSVLIARGGRRPLKERWEKEGKEPRRQRRQQLLWR